MSEVEAEPLRIATVIGEGRPDAIVLTSDHVVFQAPDAEARAAQYVALMGDTPSVHDDAWPEHWARRAKALLDELQGIDGLTASLQVDVDFGRLVLRHGQPAGSNLALHLLRAVKPVADVDTVRELERQSKLT